MAAVGNRIPGNLPGDTCETEDSDPPCSPPLNHDPASGVLPAVSPPRPPVPLKNIVLSLAAIHSYRWCNPPTRGRETACTLSHGFGVTGRTTSGSSCEPAAPSTYSPIAPSSSRTTSVLPKGDHRVSMISVPLRSVALMRSFKIRSCPAATELPG